MIEIINWKKAYTKKRNISDILKLMNNEILKSNRKDIESPCLISIENPNGNNPKYIQRNAIIHRLALTYNIVFDLDIDFQEIYIFDIKKDKIIKKFGVKSGYEFIENIIKQVKDINFSNIWKFILEYNKKN